MKIPAHYYYMDSQSSVQYTHEVKQEIDITRLLQDKPYWINPISEVHKSKTLILTDWTVRSWFDSKEIKVLECIEALLENNFEIYLWQNGSFLQLMLHDFYIHIPNKKDGVTLEPEDDIYRLAVKELKKTRQQLQLLNVHEIEALISEKPAIQNRFYLSNIQSLSPREINDFIKIYIEKNEKIDFFEDVEPIDHIMNLLNKHKNINIIKKIIKLNLNNEDLIKINQGKSLHDEKNALNQETIGEIKEIICEGIDDIDQLITLINTTIGLESLYITKSKLVKKPTLKLNRLSGPVYFHIEHSDVTQEILDMLLIAFPNLKILIIDSIKDGDFNDVVKFLDYPQVNLQNISCRNMNINADFLVKFLKKNKNLKILDFEDVTFEEEAGAGKSLLNTRFEKLQLLDLSRTDIVPLFFSPLLESAPNLNRLLFAGCDELQYDLESMNSYFDSITNLKHLKYLDIDNWGLPEDDFEVDFSKMNLVFLSAKSSIIPKKTFDQISSIKSLKTFIYSDNSLYKDNFIDEYMSFFKKNSGWKHFTLFNTPITESDVKLLSSNSDLETILYSSINSTYQSASYPLLKAFLNSSPNLKELSIGEHEKFDSGFYLEPRSLPKLTELKIDCVIDKNSLYHLINAAPRLNKLILNNIVLFESLNLKKASCQNLESIEIHGIVSTFLLKNLLSAAQNIKHVNLNNCKIVGSTNLTLDLLPYIETVSLEDSTYETSLLDKLRSVSPFLQINGLEDEVDDNDSEEKLDDSSISLDADTKQSNATLKVIKYFYPMHNNEDIPVPNYRLNIYHKTVVNENVCLAKDAFCLVKDMDLDLINCNAKLSTMLHHPEDKDRIYYHGNQKLVITSEWKSLASISPDEIIHLYNVTPATEISIQYSKKHNLYYIKSNSNKHVEVEVNFTLSIPRIRNTAPKIISDYADKFRSFTIGELIIENEEKATGSYYLEKIIEQKKGACRHRAIAFKKSIEKDHPYLQSRIIFNDCHAYVELFIDNKWVVVDLGGYPANLQIDNNNEIQQPVDSLFNIRDFNEYPADRLFKFRGLNKTYNQDMIIEKFSQYLLINNKDVTIIPKIQKGICNALVYLYNQSNINEFINMLQKINDWNGQLSTLQNLSVYFDTIEKYIRHYQLNNTKRSLHFIGNSLNQLLKEHPNQSSFILGNPWHVIAVRAIDRDHYHVYDPNFVKPDKIFRRDDLIRVILRSLGYLIFVDTTQFTSPISINPIIVPDDFIRHGGLFILGMCDNHNEIIKQIKSDKLTNPESGLFLFNNSGVSAWIIGLMSNSLNKITQEILSKYFDTDLYNAKYKITKSLEYLNSSSKDQLMQYLDKKFMKYDLFDIDCYFVSEYKANEMNAYLAKLEEKALIDEINQSDPLTQKPDLSIVAKPSKYKYKLITTEEKQSESLDLKQIALEILNNKHRKQLIECESTDDKIGLYFEINKNAGIRPILYIDKPEDLRSKGNFIIRNKDNTGILRTGTGGSVCGFIDKYRNQSSIIIINFENFNVEDIVKYNSILDKVRSVDGVNIPDDFTIIGLINVSAPNCYQGSDFYSRFNTVKQLTVNSKTSIPAIPFMEEKPAKSSHSLKIFHRPDWKNLLLGNWILDGSQFKFQRGLLSHLFGDNESKQQMLDDIKVLEIHGGLWGQPEFDFFWQQAFANGFIEHEGIRINLPPDLKIHKVLDYDWASLKSHIKLSDSKESEFHILNTSTVNDFFTHQSYDKKQSSLVYKHGIIQDIKSKQIEVILTSSISDHLWARLLSECQIFDKVISIRLTPNIILPEFLSIKNVTKSIKKALSMSGDKNLSIIESNDLDFTIHLVNKTNNFIVIDISECTPQDLFERLNTHFDSTNQRYLFKQSNAWLLEALKEGKNILLKGTFSQDIIDKLAPLLLTSTNHWSYKGKLLLVTQQTNMLDFALCEHSIHTVDNKDKLESLPTEMRILLTPFSSEPYIKLQARLNYIQNRDSKCDSQDNWQGLHSINIPITQIKPLVISTADQDSKKFIQSRIEKINSVLNHSPYVFLSGLSGVGKSTLVTEYLSESSTIYYGEDALTSWLVDKSQKRNILFIDEANLNPTNWTLFEGLFQEIPGIFYKGKYYQTTKNHKIIFAGNPLNYGDERKLARLFEMHGNSIIFDPLPAAVLYQNVLKPLLTNLPKEKIEIVASHFLNIYQVLLSYSNTDVLISPRELEMMALLTDSHHKKHPELDLLCIAKHFSYAISEPLVPNRYKSEFAKSFSPKPELFRIPVQSKKQDSYILTPSREKVFHYINDLFDLREARRKQSEEKRTATQLYGGLGGIVLEGEPGIGKSEFVIHALKSMGYCEFDETKIDKSSISNIYIKIPVSLSFTEKTSLLLKAFDMGAVVIMDEINSAPMMERLLNDLLMGIGPDKKRPSSPGFMIIGTQNPISMAGRRAQSTALSRRMITMTLPDYPREELELILDCLGLPKNEIDELINAYIECRNEAISNRLKNVPTFRHLVSIAISLKDLGVTQQIPLFQSKTTLFAHTSKKHKLEDAETSENQHDRSPKKMKFSMC